MENTKPVGWDDIKTKPGLILEGVRVVIDNNGFADMKGDLRYVVVRDNTREKAMIDEDALIANNTHRLFVLNKTAVDEWFPLPKEWSVDLTTLAKTGVGPSCVVIYHPKRRPADITDATTTFKFTIEWLMSHD